MTADHSSEIARSAKTLVEVLSQERDLLTSLLDCIGQELNALQANDPTAIESAAADKERLVDALYKRDELRRSLLSKAGLPPDPSGIEDLIRKCDPDPGQSLRDIWYEVGILTRRCHDENARNAQLNVIAQGMVRQMLSIMRGQSDHSDVYDRDGLIPASSTKALGRT